MWRPRRIGIMTTPNLSDAQRELRAAVTAGDSSAARVLVGGLLDQGVAGSALIADLLAPEQVWVGLRWQRGESSVADEHASTAVVDSALGVIESNAATQHTGEVVLAVTCAESEWHVLPARMAAQQLREAGAQVRFLGPTMPADHLREYLARLQPDALFLSATMATSLPGAARSIEASHDVGVSVVVGGAAFRADGALAARLGADALLVDARDFSTESIPVCGASGYPRLAWSSFFALEDGAAAVQAASYRGLLSRVPALQLMTPAQSDKTREDLRHIIDFLAVSLLVGEARVMRDFTWWLLDVLESRGVPSSAVVASYRAIADELDTVTGSLLSALAEEVSAA